MTKYYFKKKSRNIRKIIRFSGLGLSILGVICLAYFASPVITFYVFLSHAYASQNYETPIPKTTILTKERMKHLIADAVSPLRNIDYTNAQNWFPSLEINPTAPRINSYTLSVPKIGVRNAVVSTRDYNVGIHLVNYGGTAVPPDKGNAVIFGHSTLPQLFRINDYKTVFARLHTLESGDDIIAHVEGINYTYRVISIKIVEPEDFSSLGQEYDASYMTLITCTPPGTTWERLTVKAKLVTTDKT